MNLYDFMMNREVKVHLNFVFLKRSFKLRINQNTTIGECLDTLRKMEPDFMKHVQCSLVFDDHSRRLSLDTCLMEFGDVYWINLLVA